MARKDFWKSDWFLGVAVAVVVPVISRVDLVRRPERKAYDLGGRAWSRAPSERIAVMAIDDTGIANTGSLLPLPTAMSLAMSLMGGGADALDHARRQNGVRRDIKPANPMSDPDSDVVKVTELAIAGITDSSRTRTGVVFGAPSYRSREQRAGRKIHGLSDLFSLGVAL